jgi:RND family efflux transporter MFP subunit
MVVARTDVMRVFADIPETEAGLVTCTPDERDSVTVSVQALGNKTFEGEVTRTSWSLNRANRSLTTEIDIPNEEGALRPGMYATLQMCLDKIPDALTLPAAAVIREEAGDFCAVVENGVIARRPIELGLRVGDDVQVKSGVSENDLVVLARGADLAPGQAVEVIGAPGK